MRSMERERAITKLADPIAGAMPTLGQTDQIELECRAFSDLTARLLLREPAVDRRQHEESQKRRRD